MSNDDEQTPIICLACKGYYQVHRASETDDMITAVCAWCHRGTMTSRHRKLWEFIQERRKKRGNSVP